MSVRWLVVVLLCCAALAGCGPERGLLLRQVPVQAAGTNHPERVTDGTFAPEGASWNGMYEAVLASEAVQLRYDLGAPTRIEAARLQANHNDTYVLEGSRSGQAWQTLWRLDPIDRPGQRTRRTDSFSADVRYVQLRAEGGDGRYAVSELQLFASDAQAQRVHPRGLVDRLLRTQLMLFGFGLALWLVLTRRDAPAWWVALAGAPAAWWGLAAWRAVVDAWPVQRLELALLRVVIAVVALVAVLREGVPPPRWPAQPQVVRATLAACAVAAVLAFANLGHPQFTDVGRQEPLAAHHYDMRIYYPIAKYFDEVGFDGIYVASVLAWAEETGTPLEDMDDQPLRDIRETERMTVFRELRGHADEVRQRFGDARWSAFKKDMRYFMGTMGSGFLSSMRDHGGNATPVWVAVAHLLFASTTASSTTFLVTAWIDPLLLLAALIALWRSYGWRTAAVCAVIFGANDLYMIGVNWGGSTLRHDWMAALTLGVCALRSGRPATGGALLALGGMLRAFPALALCALPLPALWWVAEQRWRTGTWPGVAALRAAHETSLRALAGAGAAIATGTVTATLVLGTGSWAGWTHRVFSVAEGQIVNQVGLRMLVTGHIGNRDAVFWERWPLVLGVAALFVVGVALASRRRPLDQVAVLGLLWVPVVFNPLNYYLHYLFLFAVLAVPARRPPDGWSLAVWCTLLGFCVTQYAAVLAGVLAHRFRIESFFLMFTLAIVLGIALARHRDHAFAPLGATPPDP